MKINFRKIASNKRVNFKKIENVVRNKYYPENISKDKSKRLISESFVRTLNR